MGFLMDVFWGADLVPENTPKMAKEHFLAILGGQFLWGIHSLPTGHRGKIFTLQILLADPLGVNWDFHQANLDQLQRCRKDTKWLKGRKTPKMVQKWPQKIAAKMVKNDIK